jgi:acetylornithine aminotransferase
MIGLEFEKNIHSLRNQLIEKKRIFTGVSGSHIIRLLPPLTLTKELANRFINDLLCLVDSS